MVTLLLIEKVRSLSTLQKDPSVVSLSDWDITRQKERDDVLPFEGGEY